MNARTVLVELYAELDAAYLASCRGRADCFPIYEQAVADLAVVAVTPTPAVLPLAERIVRNAVMRIKSPSPESRYHDTRHP